MKTGNVWEEFEVAVYTDYEVRTLATGPVIVGASNEVLRRYRPLARSSAGLFAEFAQLDVTAHPDSALNFARRYGTLGTPLEKLFVNGAPMDTPPLDDFRSSPIASVGLKAMLGGDQVLGEALYGDHGQHSWSAQVALLRRFLEWTRIEEETSDSSGMGSATAREIRGTVIQLHVNQTLAECLGPRVTMADDFGSWAFRFEPRSLLGAIWLQATQAANEGLQHRVCARDGCRKVIAVARSVGARSDARFCSDACKSRDYRSRVRRAKQLKAKGWTGARIAKALGTTQVTVKRWLR